MSTKQKNNGSNRIVELARNNSVPLMFILICAVCIPVSGFSPGYLLNEIMTRLGRNAFLILSLLILSLIHISMTRAKERLHVYYVKERYHKKQEVSRFVKEVGQ